MQVIVEIPYVLVPGLVYTAIVYPMMSFQWTAAKFTWFFFITFFSFLYFTYFGMMTVSFSPNDQISSIIASFFYSMFSLFSGFFVPKPVSSTPFTVILQLIFSTIINQLMTIATDGSFCVGLQRIPKWWIWYYWMCPLAWTVYGLIVTQYGDLEDIIKVPGQPDQTIKFYVKDYFGYDTDFIGQVAEVLVGFPVFFALIFAFCIKTLNFQRR